MGNSKHSTKDIFAAINSIRRNIIQRFHNLEIGVRVHADAEPTRTSMTIEVSNIETDAILCVFEIPRILDIEDSGDTLVILNDTTLPAITLVSDGNSTMKCNREIPGQYDTDINGHVLYTDDIAAVIAAEIKATAG